MRPAHRRARADRPDAPAANRSPDWPASTEARQTGKVSGQEAPPERLVIRTCPRDDRGPPDDRDAKIAIERQGALPSGRWSIAGNKGTSMVPCRRPQGEAARPAGRPCARGSSCFRHRPRLDGGYSPASIACLPACSTRRRASIGSSPRRAQGSATWPSRRKIDPMV